MMPSAFVSNGVQRARYPFHEFEPRWQARWENEGIFRADRDERRPKWFIMDLPPFANGTLHLGHVRNYVLADVSARFRRMAGFNVLYTSGFDSFGLPNEMAAREVRCHPRLLAERCIGEMRAQFVRLGLGHDTRRITAYHEPAYYRWVQWVFNELVRAGLAFQRRSAVNYCPSCACALADSLVEDGGCWRCRCAVESRWIDQWFVREDGFAEELLEGSNQLPGWPEVVKRIQRDWIGRREGIEADFAFASGQAPVTAFLSDASRLPVVDFVGVGAEHVMLESLRAAGKLKRATENAIDRMRRDAPATREVRKQAHAAQRGDGIPLEVNALHPLDGRDVPVLVLEGIEPRGAIAGVFGAVDHQPVATGEPRGGAVRSAIRYRLRDWSIARQRYWGPPVPIIHCEACGAVPVPDGQLPVLLPDEVNLEHGNPLETALGFVDAPCPRCGAAGRRDTDTLEAYSSPWWMHWNCRTLSGDDPFRADDTKYWMPVDEMFGGVDQSRTCFFHLRVVARALKRLGHVQHDEPVRELIAIGMVKQDGRKMSKSAGNSVGPEALIAQYGADAVRVGTVAAAAPVNELTWTDDWARRAHDLLSRVWAFASMTARPLPQPGSPVDQGSSLRRRLAGWLEAACLRITSNYVRHDLHLAVKNIEFLFDRLRQFEHEATRAGGGVAPADLAALDVGTGALLRMLAPLAPHLCEEIWALRGGEGLMATAAWPVPLAKETRRQR